MDRFALGFFEAYALRSCSVEVVSLGICLVVARRPPKSLLRAMHMPLNGLRKRNDLQLTSALQSDTIHPKVTQLLMAASKLSSCTRHFSSSDGAAYGMEDYFEN
jgi:hypothetical protein